MCGGFCWLDHEMENMLGGDGSGGHESDAIGWDGMGFGGMNGWV